MEKLTIFKAAKTGVSDDLTPTRVLNMRYFVGEDGELNFIEAPGLTSLLSVGSNPVRGALTFKGNLYVVHYNEVHKITPSLTSAGIVGTLTTYYGHVSLAENGQQLCIVDGSNGYIYDGATFVQITDPDYLPSDFVAFKDSYFIFLEKNTGRVRISASYNGLAHDALDFKTAESAPDNALSILADQDWLWIFGVYTTELWYNAGSQFPFQRAQNGVMEWGIAAPRSAAKADNSVIWLAVNRDGGVVVLRAFGPGAPKIISNAGLSHIFSHMRVISDAVAFSYLQDGEYYYHLSFPEEQRTFVYQVSVNAWFERTSFGGRHRTDKSIYFQESGKHVSFDYGTGTLYELKCDVYTDNGSRIIREIDSRIINVKNARLFHRNFILDCETGVGNIDEPDPKVELLYSDDNKRTFSAFNERSLGAEGHYADHPRWNRLGSAVNRTYRIRYAGKTKFRVKVAYGDIDIGTVSQ